MIIESEVFLRSYDLAPRPHPLPPPLSPRQQKLYSLSQSSSVSPVKLSEGRWGGGEGVGEEPNNRTVRKPAIYKSFNTF